MNRFRWLAPAAAVGLLAALGSSVEASATPSVNLAAETLSTGANDGKAYVTKQITIAPGGSTGWHWHPGQVFAVIRAGTLTHNVADCSVDGVYPTGAPITEESGPDDVHIGRNLGPDPVVLWVLYINPSGEPLSMDVPNPGCPFE